MPIETEPSNLTSWLTTATVAAGGIYLGIRKLWLTWGADKVTLATQEVQRSLVVQLHEELTRLSGQNVLLATELNNLQLHILELTRKVTALTAENQSFVAEIAALRRELQSRERDRLP